MGLIDRLLGLVFGGGRNAVAETIEVFRENAERGAAREADLQGATLAQFAEEFRRAQRGPFDRLMDAINRIPRPAMAVGTLALFVAAMVDPSGSPRACRASRWCPSRSGGCSVRSSASTLAPATRRRARSTSASWSSRWPRCAA